MTTATFYMLGRPVKTTAEAARAAAKPARKPAPVSAPAEPLSASAIYRRRKQDAAK
jgi:hypothetical protein